MLLACSADRREPRSTDASFRRVTLSTKFLCLFVDHSRRRLPPPAPRSGRPGASAPASVVALRPHPRERLVRVTGSPAPTHRRSCTFTPSSSISAPGAADDATCRMTAPFMAHGVRTVRRRPCGPREGRRRSLDRACPAGRNQLERLAERHEGVRRRHERREDQRAVGIAREAHVGLRRPAHQGRQRRSGSPWTVAPLLVGESLPQSEQEPRPGPRSVPALGPASWPSEGQQSASGGSTTRPWSSTMCAISPSGLQQHPQVGAGVAHVVRRGRARSARGPRRPAPGRFSSAKRVDGQDVASQPADDRRADQRRRPVRVVDDDLRGASLHGLRRRCDSRADRRRVLLEGWGGNSSSPRLSAAAAAGSPPGRRSARSFAAIASR